MQNKAEKPTITSGIYKGKKLEIPDNTRPFTGIVKRILFDTLTNLIEGSDVLDLFSGSGSIGFEALSRGADKVICVDGSKDAKDKFEMNKSKILENGKENSIIFINDDYQKFIQNFLKYAKTLMLNEFDVIIIDPPFELFERLNLKNIENLLKPDGLLVLKTPKTFKEIYFKKIFSTNFQITKEKSVGVNKLYFLQK